MERECFERKQAEYNGFPDWESMKAAGWVSVRCECGETHCPGWMLEYHPLNGKKESTYAIVP
jgi:hypothetical protein